jgi:hypothetical protein
MAQSMMPATRPAAETSTAVVVPTLIALLGAPVPEGPGAELPPLGEPELEAPALGEPLPLGVPEPEGAGAPLELGAVVLLAKDLAVFWKVWKVLSAVGLRAKTIPEVQWSIPLITILSDRKSTRQIGKRLLTERSACRRTRQGWCR